MKPLIITINGEPVAQGRPRFAVVKGRAMAFDPSKSKDYKSFLSFNAQRAVEEQGWSCSDKALSVVVSAYFGVPKSKSKKVKTDMLADKIHMVKKPDIDNILKMCLDGLVQAGVMKDDSQVVECHCYKCYSEEPKVVIQLIVVGEDDG